MEKKSQKPYLGGNKLLKVQNLWQAHLSNLINNLAEEINKTKRKYEPHDKSCESSGIKY